MEFRRYIDLINEKNKINMPRIFFETGLYKGDGVSIYLNHFDKIYSCDIVEEFVNKAKERFKDRNDVVLLHGDSKDCLKSVLHIEEPIYFYLDAHYSGGPTGGEDICNGCPVLQELEILGQRKHKDIIVIDDIRLMGKACWSGTVGDETYPYTYFDFQHATIDNMIKAYNRPCQYFGAPPPYDRLILVPY